MTPYRLPTADELTYAQHQGWACVCCGKSLWTAAGGVSVGRSQGANGFSIEVYACLECTEGGDREAGRTP